MMHAEAACSRGGEQHLFNSQIKQLPVLVLVFGPQVVLDTLAPAAHIFGAGPAHLNGAKEHNGQPPRLRIRPQPRLCCCCCHDLGLQDTAGSCSQHAVTLANSLKLSRTRVCAVNL